MTSRSSLFTTFLLVGTLIINTGADSVSRKHNMSEDVACPHCPKPNMLFYYKCCGETKNDCCFYLQSWLMVVVIGILAFIVGCAALHCIRCIFCCRK